MATIRNERWAAELGVRFLQSLRARLETLTEDEQAIRDTIEGEADVDSIMETLIEQRHERLATAKAQRALSKMYAEAAANIEAQVERVEGLILQAMQAVLPKGQQKWSGPAGTASIRKGSIRCVIVDPAHVPFAYQKAAPDVAAIKKVLMDRAKEMEVGEFTEFSQIEIPGTKLVRGDDTLMITLPRGEKNGRSED